MAYTTIPASSGGSGGTVNVSTGLSGDGSVGNPLVNTAPFGPDTIIQLPNSTPAPVSAWEGIVTLTTNTAGSEASKVVTKLLSAGAQVIALDLRPTQTLFPSTTDSRFPAMSFQANAQTGPYYIPSGAFGQPAMGIAVSNASPGTHTYQLDSSGNILINNGGGGAHIWFSSTADMGIGRNSGGTNAVMQFSNTAASGSMAFTIGGNQGLGISNTRNVSLGIASLATTATDGFLYIPTCPGPPTGAPTAITGFSPVVVDGTNGKMYLRTGGSWVALN